VNAVRVVSDWIWSAVGWLRDRVAESVSWVWGLIRPLLGPVASWVERAADLVAKAFLDFARDPLGFIRRSVSWLGDMLTEAWRSISSGVNAVGSWLSSALDSARNTIMRGLADVGSSLTGFYTGLCGVISQVGNSLSVAFNGAIATVGGWVSEALQGVARALGDALSGFMMWLTGRLQWLSQSVIGVANAVKDACVGFFTMVGREFVAAVTSLFKPGSPPEPLKSEAETAFQSMIRDLEQLTKLPRSSLPRYEALATAVASVAARFLMLKLAVEGIGAAVDAAHPVKGLKAHEIASGIMGIVDMPGVLGPLLSEPIKQGIMIPWQQYWASRYTPQIPGPGDLIRFVVREVITPEEFYATMPLHGFSERWAKAYWDAHWELPAFSQVVDAYHRGIITRDELDRFIVWHDYSPTPRPGISKSDLEIMRGLLKTPIGRVDLRRGWELGAISDEELIERFRWLGYEDDAPLMAEIQKREALDAEIGKLRDNAKSDFVKGYIGENDLRGTLKALGYSPQLIEYHVQDAIQDRERKRKDMLVENYIDGYVKGIIETEDELAGLLSTVIVDPNIVSLMVEDAYIRRYKKPKASEAAAGGAAG
jgi:hypothetical protein